MSAMDKLMGRKGGDIIEQPPKPTNPMGLLMGLMKDPGQVNQMLADMTVFVQTCGAAIGKITADQQIIIEQNKTIIELLEKKSGGRSNRNRDGGDDAPAN